MKRSLLIICILVFGLSVCGCLGTSLNSLSSSKYVAVQVNVEDTGTLVSGTYPYPGMAQPDAIFYPSGNYSYQKNDSLKIVAGIIDTKGSVVSLRNNLNVIGIYSLPYELEPGLTVNSVDKNGTIEISYGNEPINLQPGSVWKSPVISTWNETNTIKYPPPNEITGVDVGTNYTYTIQYVRTWTIDNKGVFNK